jgi:hypothetical protein
VVVSLLAPETAFRDGVARLMRHFDCTAQAHMLPRGNSE